MTNTINGHKAVTINECRFFLIQPDAHGRWAIYYDRGERRCYRQIIDANGRSIPRNERKPIGRELLETVKGIVNSDLTRDEEEALLCDVKVLT